MARLLQFPISRETVAILRVLLGRALTGRLRDVALCCWSAEGGEEVFLTGRYREHPEQAVGAALRIRHAATHAAGTLQIHPLEPPP